MSIYVGHGESFEATSSNTDTGLTGTIGVRIMDGVGGTTVARTTSGIVETPAGSGIYTATLTAPNTAGTYTVVWDTGGDPVEYAVEDLYVRSTSESPSGDDLTSLAAVREFLQKDSDRVAQDDVIQALITRASRAINYTIAYFPSEETATKEFVWRGGPLNLHPYFARSIDSVTLDTDTTSTTLVDTTNYRLRPKPSIDGVYRWVTFPGYTLTPGAEREVTIVGDWGYPVIPDDVEHWAIVTVATWLRRDVSAFSTTLRLDEDRLERPDALPTAVSKGLSRYRTPRGL